MHTRRDLLKSAGALGAAAWLAPLLAACGGEGSPGGPSGSTTGASTLGASTIGAASTAGGPAADADVIAAAVRALAADLHARLAKAGSGNLTASPWSVAIALAMTREGAANATLAEMDAVLHLKGVDGVAGGFGALAARLASRAGEQKRADGSKGVVAFESANSLWGQKGFAFEQAFLATLAGPFGAPLQETDFEADPEKARAAINAWVADRTAKLIEQLIPQGAIDALTRLVLVNALHMKAPWETPFGDKGTAQDEPFTLGDGSQVQVPMMRLTDDLAYASGSGWQAVRLPFLGQELALTAILPDAGRLAALEAALGPVLDGALAAEPVGKIALGLPRFSSRSNLSLGDVLSALGMPSAFDAGTADFSRMTTQQKLFIGAVIHEAIVKVDEEGAEAAAATAVIMEATSAAPDPQEPKPVVFDRPFLYVLHDVESRLPIFVGRVADPREQA